MNFNDSITLYDILDITPDASSQDVREAYIQIKSTFNRDSIALYTLINPEEREMTLRNIEEAYFILSNTEKRREYDQKFGLLNAQENPFASIHTSIHSETISLSIPSIDRFPPMETLSDADLLLIPPTTDFKLQAKEQSSCSTEQSSQSSSRLEKTKEPFISPLSSSSLKQIRSSSSMPKIPSASKFKDYSTRIHSARSFRSMADSRARLPELSAEMIKEIETETEWSGHFLRRIRDAYKISLEEMAGITKITKNYLIAIEEEKFDKLPASVYTRGFIMQIAKVLKLPYEKVTVAYLVRFQARS